MKKLICALFVFFLTACGGPQTPQEEINATLTDMIEMIDDGEYRPFLEKYLDTTSIKVPLDKIDDERVKQLKPILEEAKTMQPSLSKDKTLAVFKKDSWEYRIKLKKVGDKWMMQN